MTDRHNKFGSREFSSPEDYMMDKHSQRFPTFAVTLILKTAIHTFLYNTQAHDDASQCKFGSKRFSISEDMEQTAFVYDLNYHCDTDLKERNLNLYGTTLWLLMMHHHTLFCCVCGSKIRRFQNTPPPPPNSPPANDY